MARTRSRSPLLAEADPIPLPSRSSSSAASKAKAVPKPKAKPKAKAKSRGRRASLRNRGVVFDGHIYLQFSSRIISMYKLRLKSITSVCNDTIRCEDLELDLQGFHKLARYGLENPDVDRGGVSLRSSSTECTVEDGDRECILDSGGSS